MAPPVEVARYTNSGALHVIIAARDPDGRWMILDISESHMTVVDVLRGHDDRLEQARAVAREYASQQEAHHTGSHRCDPSFAATNDKGDPSLCAAGQPA